MDIQFIGIYDFEKLEESDVYQMVESTAFFEAYRHVLEGLKESTPGKLPLQVTNGTFLKFYKTHFPLNIESFSWLYIIIYMHPRDA